MGKNVPFRRGRRLRGLNEFRPEQRIRFWPQAKRSPWKKALFVGRPFGLAAILAALWVGYDPAVVEPPSFLTTSPERVTERFTRCGIGRGHACVVDADTFKIGQRRIRIIGIDAPETHPSRCQEEARLAEAATAKLQELLNQGAFEMVAPIYRDHDKYGRDLRVIQRSKPDGSLQSIAEEMGASGLVHRYTGFKTAWC